MNKRLSTLRHNLMNVRGWRTRRKIVVIESDDWGSIRMPSRETYQLLREKGFHLDTDPYMKYDSLASEEDLERLFSVLDSVRDARGRPAVITANTITSNPDFEAISAARFREYHHEPFPRTLERYPAHSGSFGLWKEGIARGLFRPQYHGRDHLNIRRWIRALQQGDELVRLAFDLGMISISSEPVEKPVTYMESLEFETEEEKQEIARSLAEGLELFRDLFGYTSESYIPTCYTWDSFHTQSLGAQGVKHIQGIPYQRRPVFRDGEFTYEHLSHYTGQMNGQGLNYLVRNVYFEPSHAVNPRLVEDCMKRIRIAFRWGKPAIIGSHRLNYVGHIFPANRDGNLEALRELLEQIVRTWPDVEFLSTDRLGALITES